MLIRVLDLETTGTKPDSAVCELGWCDLQTHWTDLAGEPWGWEVAIGGSTLVNPGIPIPPEVSAIHHIVDEDVADAPPWDGVTFHIGRDSPIALAAHSAKFERQFITDEIAGGLPWICTYKCALRLWPDAPSHSNQVLRYWRKPPALSRTLASLAHRAFPDAYVTAFHLRDMLELAPLADLIAWSSQPALQVTCHIGKQRGLKWRDVDEGFLHWVSERDFDEDVLFTVGTEIERRRKLLETQALGAEIDNHD